MSKTKLTILSSFLLGTALAMSAANAAAPRSTPRAPEHLRGPVAVRLADRIGALKDLGEDMRTPRATEKPTRRKQAPPDANYTIIDEPDADPVLYGTRVFFINESNQISGQFKDSSGQYHAFLCKLPACSAR